MSQRQSCLALGDELTRAALAYMQELLRIQKSMDMKVGDVGASGVTPKSRTVVPVLAAISFSHLLNDLIQSLIPAIYPILKSAFQLDFAQIGLITLTFQLTASLLQPLVGLYTDRRPSPFSLVVGMGFT